MSAELRARWELHFSDVGGNDAERIQAGLELATRPEFKPELLAMLQRDYFEARKDPKQKGDATALSILALRRDLTVAEQKLITDELEGLVNEEDGTSFINPAIHLLEHYPSPEHEAVAMRFLNRDGKQDHTLLSAFETLSAIGGAKSLDAMSQVAARFQAKNPKYWFLKEMNQHIGTLETRLKQGTAAGQAQAAPTSARSPKPPVADTPVAMVPTTPEPKPASTTDWHIWLGLLGGLILVIALSCRVFYKKH
jgi:hypothetical protein